MANQNRLSCYKYCLDSLLYSLKIWEPDINKFIAQHELSSSDELCHISTATVYILNLGFKTVI